MKINNCRMCNGNLSIPIIEFPPTSIANELPKILTEQEKFPLNVCRCESCGAYQLDEEISGERLFTEYVYVSSTSSKNVEYFENLSKHLINKLNLFPGSSMCDIASNDGLLLSKFKNKGLKAVGIDPAANIAEIANNNGLETVCDFFSEKLSKDIVEKYGKFNLVTALNVFAHLSDLKDFALGVKNILAENGTFVFEVSYFIDVCENLSFDTIYMEHKLYHTVKPLIAFFQSIGMELIDVEQIDTHGGSIRCYVKDKEYTPQIGWKCELCDGVLKCLEREKGIEGKIEKLKTDIKNLGDAARSKIEEIKTAGKTIGLYGIPAKASTLIAALGIDMNKIDYCFDDNSLKHFRYFNGCQILPAEQIFTLKPDYLIICAWNFADRIMLDKKDYEGKWLIFIPEIKEI